MSQLTSMGTQIAGASTDGNPGWGAAEETKPCPVHGDYCPVCCPGPDALNYDVLSETPLRLKGKDERWITPATSEHRNKAQGMVTALEVWDGQHLAYLADLTPRQINEAAQVAAWRFPHLDGGMTETALLFLACEALQEARSEVTRLRANPVEYETPHPS